MRAWEQSSSRQSGTANGGLPDRSRLSPACSWFECYLLPVLVTLLGMGLYLYGLDSKSLWFDELGTLTCSGWHGSWMDAIREPLTIPTTPKPPLSFLIAHLFLSLGDRVFLLRFQAALFATLTIPLVMVLAGRLLPAPAPGPRPALTGVPDPGTGRRPLPRRAGLLAAFLLAISPYYLRYAQEARMYALWTCLSLLSLYLFWRALTSTQARWWALFALVSALALYTHLFALLPLGVMALYALGLLLRRGHRTDFPFQVWHFAAAMAALVLLFLPLAPFLAQGLASEEGLGGEPVPDWGATQFLSSLRLFSGGSYAGLILYASLLLVGAAALFARGRESLILMSMWILLPLVIVFSAPFSHAARLRYFIFALPVYLLLVAYGLTVVLRWLGHRAEPRPAGRRQVLATFGLVLLVAGLAALNAPRLVRYQDETKQGWRKAMSLLNARTNSGDQVFVRHIYHQKGLLFYASQLPPGGNSWNERNVQVFPQDLAQAFPPGDGQGKWIVGPLKERFLPGGEFETWIRPHYGLGSPLILPPSGVPQEAKLLAPTSYRTLVVVPVEPYRLPLVRFWADASTLPSGGCTQLRWAVEGVKELYLDGEGVVGQGQRQVCPPTARSYELRAVQLDGSSTQRQVDIAVRPPVPTFSLAGMLP